MPALKRPALLGQLAVDIEQTAAVRGDELHRAAIPQRGGLVRHHRPGDVRMLDRKVPPKPQHSDSWSCTTRSTLASRSSKAQQDRCTFISRRAEQEVCTATFTLGPWSCGRQSRWLSRKSLNSTTRAATAQARASSGWPANSRPMVLDHAAAGTGRHHDGPILGETVQLRPRHRQRLRRMAAGIGRLAAAALLLRKVHPQAQPFQQGDGVDTGLRQNRSSRQVPNK